MQGDVRVLVEGEDVALEGVEILLVVGLLLVEILLVFVLLAVDLVDALLHQLVGVLGLAEGFPSVLDLQRL